MAFGHLVDTFSRLIGYDTYHGLPFLLLTLPVTVVAILDCVVTWAVMSTVAIAVTAAGSSIRPQPTRSPPTVHEREHDRGRNDAPPVRRGPARSFLYRSGER